MAGTDKSKKASLRLAQRSVGEILSGIRRENRWTLAQVSERTGVSISTLSKIENNISAPTYGVLTRLAAGLGVDFVEFLDMQAPVFAPGMRAVTRAGAGSAYETPIGRYLAMASELAAKTMQPMVVTVPLKRKRAPQFRSSHSGEEFLFVIEGTVEFYLEPYAPLLLNPGDSVYFDGSSKHGFASCGESEARILCVCLMGKSDMDGRVLVHDEEAGD
ncbi:helix-turn-helix domain-containing protein [Aquamicrobium defluvii]|uniref:XRE family transcriptional regulator n=1 Tax=Aquamicrobium defluvii TaxID=69279 RepID=A0A4V3DKJ7_9HYPH|nr:XRE family transcriptional regulator [Aquamicrobium defluvii]TDR34831.1 XRE family transcriptional regulator [Aquamicrobium defluvii]